MSQAYRPPGFLATTPAVVCAVAWAGMTVTALGFVAHFGHDAPWADEWEFVPALTGHEPVGPWLWTQHNEHRLPLPRLLFWTLYQLTGDFRSGMVAQVLMLSALSIYVMRAAAQLRGHSSVVDAAVPLGLLHVGHAENFLMGYQVCFALVTVLVTFMLVEAVRATPESARQTAWRVGVALLLLEACGGAGLVFAMPVGAWLILLAVKHRAWAGLLFAALAAAYLAVYFVGYERPAHHPPTRPDQLGLAILITLEVLGMGFGYGAVAVWPTASAAVVGLLGLTACHGRRSPGVLALCVGTAGVAAAIGYGRAGFDSWDMGLWSRYGLLAWPALAAAHLTFAGEVGRLRRVPAAIAMITVILVPWNTVAGWRWAGVYTDRQALYAADEAAGMPAEELAAKHLADMMQDRRAAGGIPMLRAVRSAAR